MQSSPSMASDELVAGSLKYAFYIELVSDVASHTGLHVDLAIFSRINLHFHDVGVGENDRLFLL